MAVWEELRIALAGLLQERPGAVTLYPDLDGDGGPPPYQVGLAPWAEVPARRLHERFGDLDGMAAAQQWLVSTWDTALADPESSEPRSRP